MYHRVRRKMKIVQCAIIIVALDIVAALNINRSISETTHRTESNDFENNVIDFDDDFTVKFDKKYGVIPWHASDKNPKESHRYTIVKDDLETKVEDNNENKTELKVLHLGHESTTETDYSVIPLELISTTENYLQSIIESTTDQDLSVIPLSSTIRDVPNIQIDQTVTLPVSTQRNDMTTDIDYVTIQMETTTKVNFTQIVQTTTVNDKVSTSTDFDTSTKGTVINKTELVTDNPIVDDSRANNSSKIELQGTDKSYISSDDMDLNNTSTNTSNNLNKTSIAIQNVTNQNGTETFAEKRKVTMKIKNVPNLSENTRIINEMINSSNSTTIQEVMKTNSSKNNENVTLFNIDSIEVDEKEVPVFTELDAEDQDDVPEDYYDSKDVVPTSAPQTNALSVLVGLAGSVVESVVESVAERVVPKGIYDLFKRMQRQSEALEAERLRSREENGGLGQFGRGILKTISSGLSKPLSQLMAGVRDIGSLDTDRGFVGSVASGVSSVATVATTLADAFKDRVQAIYPGTVWCGDGHSATARSGELGLFFFTDTCCRQHDACKIYIAAGDTKYGLTNTGLFTRSHCSCDAKFRECLRKTNSLVSAQIGLTYFNVLGPQCFRRAHPIVKCLRRTRITGQKCEEYELDYTKPKMWQWFDNETF